MDGNSIVAEIIEKQRDWHIAERRQPKYLMMPYAKYLVLLEYGRNNDMPLSIGNLFFGMIVLLDPDVDKIYIKG